MFRVSVIIQLLVLQSEVVVLEDFFQGNWLGSFLQKSVFKMLLKNLSVAAGEDSVFWVLFYK